MRRTLVPLLLLGTAALASCTGAGTDARDSGTAGGGEAPAAPSPTAGAPRWEANPREGVSVRAAGDKLVVETGPHTVLWPAGATALEPPYTVRATLRKTSGRIHEGTGLLFGGTGLEGPEADQRYSYFLTRGDGSFLIKQRLGGQVPVVRDWTRHPEILRDRDGVGGANELAVEVGERETVFRINGAEVARVPSAELQVRGGAGVRASHDVQLEVTGFGARGAAAAAPADSAARGTP